MRLLLLKICALVIALGVVVFVVEASRSRAREPAKPVAPLPAAAVSAATGDAGPPPANDYGIIGPATKADPHTMRRAAESLERRAPDAPSAASTAPGKP